MYILMDILMDIMIDDAYVLLSDVDTWLQSLVFDLKFEMMIVSRI